MARQLLGNRSASSSSQPSFQFFPNPGFFNPHRTISAAHSISFHLQTLLSNSLHHFPNPHFLQLRPLSSSPSGASNIVVIKSEDKFSTAVSKAKDGAVPALFYFTAVWCGPCRFISPIIGELSEQYPHVTTYKVDIDEKGQTNTLDELNISSVLTFQFFKDGGRRWLKLLVLKLPARETLLENASSRNERG